MSARLPCFWPSGSQARSTRIPSPWYESRNRSRQVHALMTKQDGGLYCDKSGKLSKPFPDKPYCVRGVESVKVINKCKSSLSWCQTMLPGDESMIIPTLVDSEALIAVPDEKY